MSTTASDVRSIAEQLREQGKDQPARMAEQAAERAERVGDYLKRSDGDTILRDAENFGRRQPWAVMFGGLAAGFLASRFLKASSSRRYESSYETQSAPALAQPSTVRPPATTVPPAAPVLPPTPGRLGEPLPGGPGGVVDPIGGVMPNPGIRPTGER